MDITFELENPSGLTVGISSGIPEVGTWTVSSDSQFGRYWEQNSAVEISAGQSASGALQLQNMTANGMSTEGKGTILISVNGASCEVTYHITTDYTNMTDHPSPTFECAVGSVNGQSPLCGVGWISHKTPPSSGKNPSIGFCLFRPEPTPSVDTTAPPLGSVVV